MKFTDSDLIDSEMAHTLSQDNNPLKDLFKPDFLEKLEKKEIESFEKAKTKWVALAQNNSIQISGFIDDVFKRSKKFIYNFLNIKSVKDIIDSHN